MDSGTVLVLAEEDDPQVRHVTLALAERGARTLIFDPGRLPGTARLSVALDPSGAARRTLVTREERFDLDRLTSVWFRRPGPAGDGPPGWGGAPLEGFTSDVWDTLTCPVVPASRSVILRSRRRLHQLSLAGRLGFTLPSTLVSTDRGEVLDFYLAHRGQIVTQVLDRPWDVAEPAPPAETPALPRQNGAAAFPLAAQANVPCEVALRVIVAGSRVFAAEIRSGTDGRRLWPHKLPGDVRRRCLRLMRRLGLSFGAIDLRLTPEGRHVFLQADPAGGFLLIEQITAMPITQALCDLLLTPRPLDRDPSSQRRHAAERDDSSP
ncbi:hypothetical protein Sme01_67040 [Sphaerisporangium melleum]|uniref:ATP-grasp domain-containing protein n=1 Tax=Sphaerisporangium melleum TaxID=321316 RepID=A0A917VRB7_9ACTN|nr:ATP-dependent carboxylate-amine ligase [Sphaerisporangium melleum]GGL06728.1 hypothetical protein GCM10007964_56270 [Sphaerisporangium melleum]GII74228.1 hypothetical protein Sme01_67040 [Sphaerisporangium melleum]